MPSRLVRSSAQPEPARRASAGNPDGSPPAPLEPITVAGNTTVAPAEIPATICVVLSPWTPVTTETRTSWPPRRTVSVDPRAVELSADVGTFTAPTAFAVTTSTSALIPGLTFGAGLSRTTVTVYVTTLLVTVESVSMATTWPANFVSGRASTLTVAGSPIFTFAASVSLKPTSTCSPERLTRVIDAVELSVDAAVDPADTSSPTAPFALATPRRRATTCLRKRGLGDRESCLRLSDARPVGSDRRARCGRGLYRVPPQASIWHLSPRPGRSLTSSAASDRSVPGSPRDSLAGFEAVSWLKSLLPSAT